jgi:hypothetical protein
LIIGFINYLQVATTIKYNPVTDFHTTNHSLLFFSDYFLLVFTIRFLATDVGHRNYELLNKSYTTDVTVLQHT